MSRSVWTTLALLHEAKMPMADWRRHLAGDLDGLRGFLERCTGEIAGTIPCPRSGQRLHVAERGRKYVAYPEEGFEGDSTQLEGLSLADVILWRLDVGALERDLCRALDVTPAGAVEYGTDEVRLIGTSGAGEARKRIYLGLAANEETALRFCLDLAQMNRERSCLVLPSYFARCDEYLRRCEHDMIVLEETATLGPEGLAAKRRETATEAEGLVTVVVVGDYKALKLCDGTVVDLSRRTKCRAFVRHLHERRLSTGNREFFYDEEVEKVNAGQSRILIQSDDFKFGLFRGIHQHFDLLFTVLDKGNGRYRINF